LTRVFKLRVAQLAILHKAAQSRSTPDQPHRPWITGTIVSS
jgi:hypothetical protein